MCGGRARLGGGLGTRIRPGERERHDPDPRAAVDAEQAWGFEPTDDDDAAGEPGDLGDRDDEAAPVDGAVPRRGGSHVAARGEPRGRGRGGDEAVVESRGGVPGAVAGLLQLLVVGVFPEHRLDALLAEAVRRWDEPVPGGARDQLSDDSPRARRANAEDEETRERLVAALDHRRERGGRVGVCVVIVQGQRDEVLARLDLERDALLGEHARLRPHETPRVSRGGKRDTRREGGETAEEGADRRAA